MKNILCFGDSNTFGVNPQGGRYTRDVRWTGILQKMLGDDYYVIEEGMGARNTVFDDPLEMGPTRNGLKALPICLQSHKPLDLVIVSLGINDCRSYFNASPKVIARGVEIICDTIENFQYNQGIKAPKILIVSPNYIGDNMEKCPYIPFDDESRIKSRELLPYYKAVAKNHNYLFLNAAEIAKASEYDQIHMPPEGHKAVAEALFKIIKENI